jgi:hypothetical protein
MATDDFDTNSPGAVLARIETKLDKALDDLKDHETRLRVLEKKVWLATGLAALFAGGGGAWLNTLLGG